MNKKLLFLTVLFLSFTSVFAGGSKESTRIDYNGTIDYLDGDVLINSIPAEFGLKVETGDIIETGSDSFCDIIFNSANVFRMEPDTVIQINWTDNSLNLKKGSIASVFEKLDDIIDSKDNFKIITPSMTAGVRGTAFYVKVEDESNTFICTCNGSLNLYKEGADSIVSTSKHHKAFRFTRSGDKVITESAKLLYHDDPGMNAVADIIGVKIPWDSMSY